MSNSEEIERILGSYGLKVKSEEVMKNMLSKFKEGDIVKPYDLLEYIINDVEKDDIKISKPYLARQAISKLSFGLGKFRDDFIEKFLSDKPLNTKGNNTLRRNAEEDRFINNLAKRGLYVTYIQDSLPPITDINSLITVLKDPNAKISMSSSNSLNLYRDFGIEILNNPELEKLVINNISNNLFHGARKKSEQIKKIEDKYGIKICRYNIKYGENMTEEKLIRYIKDGKISIMIDDVGTLNAQDGKLKDELLPMIAEREKELQKYIDLNKDKEMVDKLLKALYVKYGKDATVLAFNRFCENKREVSRVKIEGEEHEFVGEKRALKISNHNYIEHILKNAKDMENNYTLNPKARRLVNVIIAMHSAMMLEGKKEQEIYDKLNEALMELILDGKRDSFDEVAKNLNSREIRKAARGMDIDITDLSLKMDDFKLVEPKEVAKIITSSEIDRNIAEDQNITMSPLEKELDSYTIQNDHMYISTTKCVNTIKSSYISSSNEDKSSLKANMQASKNNLLMTLIKSKEEAKKNSQPDPYPELKIDSKQPIWEQLSSTERFIEESVKKYSVLKRDIDSLRSQIANKRMAEQPINDDELKLNELLIEYNKFMEIENKGNMITKYITIKESQKIVGQYKETNRAEKGKSEKEH